MPDKVPPALRPGETDDVLETDRLTKIIRWGFIIALFFSVFLPLYWLREPGRMSSTDKRFAAISIERGKKYFALRTDPVTGAENLSGKECARCHGVHQEGGTNDFLDTSTGQRRIVQVPALNTVFSRYDPPPAGYKDTRAFVRETVERGRPGTDMPTWGNKFGGPLTDQELDDIVNYLESVQKVSTIPVNATGDVIFAQNCSPCHGQAGAGGSGPSMKGGSESVEFPNIADHIAFVKAGSKKDQPYGTHGKGTGGMPSWQGKLTDEQIQKVVEYERSL